MKNIKFLLIICALTVFLHSCNSLGEAGKYLRNDKSPTTDEFLVKKKQPLTLPPDFEIVPQPGSIESKSEIKENNIEKLLKKNQSESSNSQSKSSSTENSIINQIRK